MIAMGSCLLLADGRCSKGLAVEAKIKQGAYCHDNCLPFSVLSWPPRNGKKYLAKANHKDNEKQKKEEARKRKHKDDAVEPDAKAKAKAKKTKK